MFHGGEVFEQETTSHALCYNFFFSQLLIFSTVIGMSGTMDISDATGQESVQENITENNKMEEVDSTEQSEESHIEQTPQEIEMENALEALKLMEKVLEITIWWTRN